MSETTRSRYAVIKTSALGRQIDMVCDSKEQAAVEATRLGAGYSVGLVAPRDEWGNLGEVGMRNTERDLDE